MFKITIPVIIEWASAGNEYSEWHYFLIVVFYFETASEDIHMDKWTHSGVCDTPLHGMFAEFNLFFQYKIILFRI